jgi:hypothetical protein
MDAIRRNVSRWRSATAAAANDIVEQRIDVRACARPQCSARAAHAHRRQPNRDQNTYCQCADRAPVRRVCTLSALAQIVLKETQRQQGTLSISVSIVEMQSRQFTQCSRSKGFSTRCANREHWRSACRRRRRSADTRVQVRISARATHRPPTRPAAPAHCSTSTFVSTQLRRQCDAVLRRHAVCAKRFVTIDAFGLGQRGKCALNKEHVARIQ